MRTRMTALMITGAALTCFSAIADAPAPIEGSVFVFDDGRVERFISDNGQTRTWATRRGREYTRAANPALPILQWSVGGRSGESEIHGDAASLWPLRPGTSARYRVRSTITERGRTRSAVRPWTCRVSETQPLQTPAGTFSTTPITCERYSLNTMRLVEMRTWWWSDDVGHYVRRRYQNYRDGETQDMQLCAALSASAANNTRIEATLDAC